MDGYAAHIAGDWVIDKAATATQAGSRFRACTTCSREMERETIPATGGGSSGLEHSHSWSTSWTSDAAHHWHVCTAGNCPLTEVSQMDGYAVHIAGNWVIDKAATVNQAGSKHRACTVCSYEMERKAIPATGGSTSSGSSSSSESASSSGGSSGGSQTTTSKNPDGSTTTTTTNKTTGVVTETIKRQDGSQTVIETKKDGTVTTTDKAADGATSKTVAKADGSIKTTVRWTDGSTGEVSTEPGGKTLAVVRMAGQEGRLLPLPVLPAGTELRIHTGSKKAVQVEIPLSRPVPGMVAVLVNGDGDEIVMKTSIPTKNGLAATISNGAILRLRDNSKQFVDITDHWARDAIDFTSARELFTGKTANTFDPDSFMTRAMLMTVLARLDGADTSGGGVWYEKGVDWAVSKGVSSGDNPEAFLTREQIITMLYRYAGMPGTEAKLPSDDANMVSTYAREAMAWAVNQGIMNGYHNGRLAPQERTTRAQVAVILKRYLSVAKTQRPPVL